MCGIGDKQRDWVNSSLCGRKYVLSNIVLMVALMTAFSWCNSVRAQDQSSVAGQQDGSNPGSQSSAPPVREPLKIKIEHQEILPPVDQGFQPGGRFDPSRVEQRASVLWVRIPPWFAGRWQSTLHTQISKRSLQNGQELLHGPESVPGMRTDGHGLQMDSQGGIWHRIKLPFSSSVPRDGYVNYQFITNQEYVENSQSEVVIHFLGIQSFVDPRSGRTMNSVQVETIQTYQPVSNDQLQCSASLKEFDANGRPTMLTKEVWSEDRISPFSPVDHRRGEDLRTSFCNFLVSHGMSDLLPQVSGTPGFPTN